MRYVITEYKDYAQIKIDGRPGRPTKRGTLKEAFAYIDAFELDRLKNVQFVDTEPILKPYLMKAIEERAGFARSFGIKRYNTAPHALDKDEMISVAYWGLCDAARRWEKYCDAKGFRSDAMNYFTTYAYYRIKGAVEDFIRQQDWATRSLRERSKVLTEAAGEGGATRQELSERTGMPLQEIHEVVAGMNRAPVSLDLIAPGSEWLVQPHGDSGAKVVAYYPELISSDSVESEVEVNELLAVFGDAVEGMSEEAQIIVGLHYYKNLELKKISALLNITEARASQIHTQACLYLLEVMKQAAGHADSD